MAPSAPCVWLRAAVLRHKHHQLSASPSALPSPLHSARPLLSQATLRCWFCGERHPHSRGSQGEHLDRDGEHSCHRGWEDGEGQSGLHLEWRDCPLSSQSWVTLNPPLVGRGMRDGLVSKGFAPLALCLIKRGPEAQRLQILCPL